MGEKIAELRREALDRDAIEEVGGEVEGRRHSVRPVDDIEREVEVRAGEIDDADLRIDPLDVVEPARRDHVVELGLEQRIVAQATPRLQVLDQPLERHVLVCEPLDDRVLDASQKRREALRRVDLDAHDERVHKKADEVVELARAAACRRRTDPDIVLAGIPMQKQRVGRQQDHEHARALRLGESPKLLGERRVDGERDAVAAMALRGRARAVVR